MVDAATWRSVEQVSTDSSAALRCVITRVRVAYLSSNPLEHGDHGDGHLPGGSEYIVIFSC